MITVPLHFRYPRDALLNKTSFYYAFRFYSYTTLLVSTYLSFANYTGFGRMSQ